MPSSGVQTCALRSEEHTSELQSHDNLACRLLLEKITDAAGGNRHPGPNRGTVGRGGPACARAIRPTPEAKGRVSAHRQLGTAGFAVVFLRAGAPPGSPPFPLPDVLPF